LAVLNELGQALTARLSVEDVLKETHRQTSRLMDTSNFYIGLYDPEKHEINVVLDITNSVVQGASAAFSADEGIGGYIVRNQTPVLIQEGVADWYEEMGVKQTGPTGALSWLGTPLMISERVLGVMALQSYATPRLYDEHDRDLLTSIASQAAIALQNAYLFEEIRDRAEEVTVLNELGQALTAQMSVDGVLEETHRQTSRLLDTTNFTIGLYDSERDEIAIAYTVTESELDQLVLTMSTDQGASGHIIRNRTSVLIREDMTQWNTEMDIPMVGEPALSWLGVPLIAGNQVLGVMYVQSYTIPGLYDEHDRDLLTAIANQVAIALQNAYLFEETRSRAQRLAVVNRIARVASATLDLDNLLEVVYEEIAPAFQSDAASIALYDKGANELNFEFLIDEGIRRPSERHPLGVGVTSIVVAKKKPIIVHNEEEYRRLQPQAHLFGTMKAPLSWLGVPLLVGDRAIGAISIQSYEANVWDEEDELLLFTIADQVAVAIENARLYEAVQQELAERKQAEETLRESERRFRSVAETANDALIIFDSQGYIFFWNRAAQDIFGYGASETTQRHLLASLVPERFQDVSQLEQELLAEDSALARQAIEVTGVRKDGSGFPVELSLATWKTREGSFFTAIARDITERKRAEEELARSNKELEQFAYIVSHDLQEPLRMVRSYLQLLERRYKDQLDEEANQFVWFAVDGATRMQTLINDLLTYSRVTTRAKPFKSVDCSTLLDFVRTDLQIAIAEGGAVMTSDPLPTLTADATQIKQVLQNLVSNGIKFHKEGIAPQVHVGAERRHDGWLFSVRDNGIGIDPKHYDRIFVIFQRLHTRDEYPGTGIGLAVCKKIVERHGGNMWVESEPDQGSTFYFTVPDRGKTS
jgi:PAS domain S-box-containing protein